MTGLELPFFASSLQFAYVHFIYGLALLSIHLIFTYVLKNEERFSYLYFSVVTFIVSLFFLLKHYAGL